MEHFARTLNHCRWHARQTGDVDPVTASRRASDNAMQEHHGVVLLSNADGQITDPRTVNGKINQFVIMRREQRATANAIMQMFGDRPRQTDAVIRRRATPDFIKYHQTTTRGVVENRRRLGHLDHERRLPPRQFVARPNASKNAIDHADVR